MAKQKTKDWVQIKAPNMFKGIVLGETISIEKSDTVGRVIEISLMDLVNDTKKYYINLLFKIDDIKDGTAITKYVGHICTKDFVTRIVRLRSTRVDNVEEIELKDKKIILKTIAVTKGSVSNKVSQELRAAIKENLNESLKALTVDEFVKVMIEGNIQKKIKARISKIYPVKGFEFRTSSVI